MTKKKVITWTRFFTRGHHPLLYIDIVMRSHRDWFHRYFGLPPITHWARHSGSLWVDREEMERIYDVIRRTIATRWPMAMIAKMKCDTEAMNAFVENARPTTTDLRRAFRIMEPAFQSTYFPVMVGKVIEEELATRAGGLASKTQRAIARALTQPLYPTMQQRYAKELRRTTRLNDLIITRLIKQYGWIRGYVMDVKPLTVRDIQEDFKKAKMGKSDIVSLPRLSVDPTLARLVRLGRFYSWFRDWRLFQISKCFYHLKPVLETYATDLRLDYHQLRQLTAHELLTKTFRVSDITQRQREYGVTLMNKDVTVVTGRTLERIKKRIHEPVEMTHVITGTIAHNGVVKGKVWIANAYTFSKPHHGDILVTSETTPESLPYLKGIKAIVTDEGGITSHAAIIARELNIPCIIGTKQGSIVLRNGDYVEVDAYHGTVTILR